MTEMVTLVHTLDTEGRERAYVVRSGHDESLVALFRSAGPFRDFWMTDIGWRVNAR